MSCLLMETSVVLTIGASNAFTVVPSTSTVLSSLTVVSVTLPFSTLNVDVVIFSYSVPLIVRVAVSSSVYVPSGRLILRASLPDVHVMDWPFAEIAGPLTRAVLQSTVVPVAAVSFIDAPGSSGPLFIMSCLLIETSYVVSWSL